MWRQDVWQRCLQHNEHNVVASVVHYPVMIAVAWVVPYSVMSGHDVHQGWWLNWVHGGGDGSRKPRRGQVRVCDPGVSQAGAEFPDWRVVIQGDLGRVVVTRRV